MKEKSEQIQTFLSDLVDSLFLHEYENIFPPEADLQENEE